MKLQYSSVSLQRALFALITLIISFITGSMELQAQQHFSFTSQTGDNATVIIIDTIKTNIGGFTMETGDEIGAFTTDGLCVGAVVFQKDSTVAVTVWSDNSFTPVKDGITPGDTIRYRVWRKSSGLEYQGATPIFASNFRTDPTYSVNAIYLMTSLQASQLSGPTVQLRADTLVCAGSSVTIAADIQSIAPVQSIVWEERKGTASNYSVISGASGTTLTVSNFSVNTTYRVTVTDNQPVTSSNIIALKLRPEPAPQITGNQSPCINQEYSYSTPSVQGHTYSWGIEGGTIISETNNTVTVSWNSAGAQSLIVTEQNPCVSRSFTFAATVIDVPNPTITGEALGCVSVTQSYSVANVDGDTFLWSVSGGEIVSTNGTSSIDIAWNQVGIGSIQIQQSNQCFTTTISRSVTVRQEPNPQISGDTLVCGLQSLPYSVITPEGNTNTWSIDNTQIGTIQVGQGTNEVVVSWTQPGTTFITVTQANNCGVITDTIPIQVFANPAPTITGGSPVSCLEKTTTLSISSSVGDAYLWTVSGGEVLFGQSTANVRVRWTTTGTAEVSVQQSNQCFTTTATRNFIVRDVPTPQITGDSIICGASIGKYSLPLIPNGIISWELSSNAGNITQQNDSSLTVQWFDVGIHQVIVTQENTCGVNTDTFDVTVYGDVDPEITGIDTVCGGRVVRYSVGGFLLDEFIWSVENGTVVAGQGTPLASIQWNQQGTGTVSLIQRNPCDTAISSFTVEIIPAPNPTITGETEFCRGKTTSYSVETIAGSDISWVVTNGNIIAGQGTGTVSVIWDTVGTGTLAVAQNEECGAAVDTVTVNVTAPDASTINGTTEVFINAQAVESVYSVEPRDGHTYSWSVEGGGSIVGSTSSATLTVRWQSGGIARVHLLERYVDSCLTENSLSINVVNEFFAISAPFTDTTLTRGDTMTLYVNIQGGSDDFSFQWSPTDSLDNAIFATPKAFPSDTTVYTVTVTDNVYQFIETTTFTVNVKISSSVIDFGLSKKQAMTIAPHPFATELKVTFMPTMLGNIQLSLINALGTTVRTHSMEVQTLSKQKSTFETRNLANGLYLLRIEDVQGRIIQQAIIRSGE